MILTVTCKEGFLPYPRGAVIDTENLKPVVKALIERMVEEADFPSLSDRYGYASRAANEARYTIEVKVAESDWTVSFDDESLSVPEVLRRIVQFARSHSEWRLMPPKKESD